MKKPMFLTLTLLSAFWRPLSASDTLQCYSFPVVDNTPGFISKDEDGDYQRRFEYAQMQGLDMQHWQDTAMFAFSLYFKATGPDTSHPDPKDRSKPLAPPLDTVSPKAFKAWSQVMFTEYGIYDYYDPSHRLPVPLENHSFYTPLFGTRATMEALLKECFVNIIDAGEPGHPISKLNRSVRAHDHSGRKPLNAFDASGRINAVSGRSQGLLRFRKHPQ